MPFVFSVDLLASGKIGSCAFNTRRSVGLEAGDDRFSETEILKDTEGLTHTHLVFFVNIL